MRKLQMQNGFCFKIDNSKAIFTLRRFETMFPENRNWL